MKGQSLKRLDEICRTFDFASRTEFMRQAIRKMVEDYEYRIAIRNLKKLRGSSKTTTSDEELEKIREEVARELYPKFVK
ncbi:MAG: ribbon-helix-helix protein, CopG family [Candidatus Diapherotrites archaeon]|nr:ribbon-helix-helix protein, CopG family [Candidatus Diapherotrites archaeon]